LATVALSYLAGNPSMVLYLNFYGFVKN